MEIIILSVGRKHENCLILAIIIIICFLLPRMMNHVSRMLILLLLMIEIVSSLDIGIHYSEVNKEDSSCTIFLSSCSLF